MRHLRFLDLKTPIDRLAFREMLIAQAPEIEVLLHRKIPKALFEFEGYVDYVMSHCQVIASVADFTCGGYISFVPLSSLKEFQHLPKACFIDMLFVPSHHRGMGLGTELMLALLTYLTEKNQAAYTLVHPEDKAYQHVLEKTGFGPLPEPPHQGQALHRKPASVIVKP
jgi:GNAT superfamily N-acetyltransferase